MAPSVSPCGLVAAVCCHVDVNLKRGGGVFARHSRQAVAIHNLLAASAVAQDGVSDPTASGDFILTKFNGADFRVQGFAFSIALLISSLDFRMNM